MINVVYDRNDHLLTVEGHAYSAEPGRDLVCASASILAYTLAANVESLHALGRVTEPRIEFADGRAAIGCKAAEQYNAVVTLIFDSLCDGFSLLGENYPDYISFTIKNV